MRRDELMQRKRTAYHEAGHAVVIVAVGVQLRMTTIRQDGTGESHFHAELPGHELAIGCGMKLKPDLLKYLAERAKKEIIINLAGPLSEAWFLWDRHEVLDIEELEGEGERNGADIDDAQRLAKRYFPKWDGRDWVSLAQLMQQVLEDNWNACARVADHLYTRGRISGKLVAEIVDRYGRRTGELPSWLKHGPISGKTVAEIIDEYRRSTGELPSRRGTPGSGAPSG